MTASQTDPASAPRAQEPPFFLVGSERSGTTLLRLMLSHHPRIECAPEFEFLVDALPESGWPDLAGYADYLATNRIFVPHELTVDVGLGYQELAASFVRQYCERSGKPVHGATCHHHFERLPRVFPDARFVHLVRDGRDVARSCIGMGWAANVWFGAERWLDALDSWQRLRAQLEPDRFCEVRYEDLIREPEQELDRVAGFLGEGFDPAMFGYVDGTTYDLPDPKLIEQWRRKLSQDELGLLEARIGRQLRSYDYPESGVPATAVGAARQARLTLDNRLGLFRRNRAKYGIPLMLKGRLARGLGLKGLQRSVQLERNAIDNAHIR